jgi:hypothetical protein
MPTRRKLETEGSPFDPLDPAEAQHDRGHASNRQATAQFEEREEEPLHLAMKTDGNGRKNPISTSVSIFFGGNGIGFGKCRFENGIGICGHTETDKYGWRAGKLN